MMCWVLVAYFNFTINYVTNSRSRQQFQYLSWDITEGDKIDVSKTANEERKWA